MLAQNMFIREKIGTDKNYNEKHDTRKHGTA